MNIMGVKATLACLATFFVILMCFIKEKRVQYFVDKHVKKAKEIAYKRKEEESAQPVTA